MSTIVSDIDGTLIMFDGGVNNEVNDFLQEHSDEYDIVLVTARSEARRSETQAKLRTSGVNYTRLLMNKVGPSHEDGLRSKIANAKTLNDVQLVIENDADARSAYADAGFNAVSPGSDLEAALGETHDESMRAVTFSSNAGMKTAAARALQWKREGRAGGTRVGLARANQIVNDQPLSEQTVVRMFSFFSRHEVDKQATGFNTGEAGYPSAGRVAWDLWGGDAGFTWSTNLMKEIRKQ